MTRLGDDFLDWLAGELQRRVDPGDEEQREAKWLTAHQIASWWRGAPQYDQDELDRALLEGWENEHGRFAARRIRPAKYPSFDLYRLWGHESVVEWRDPATLDQRRTRDPEEFDRIQIAQDAPLVFVSHSTLDRDFALRVRASLASRGLRPWLSEEQIQRGEPIFEAVRAAVARAAATVVLIARNSLGSAWVHTEFVAGTDPIVVCNGRDDELVALLATWRPPEEPGGVARFNAAALEPLTQAYRAEWEARKQDDVQATLASSAGGRSVWKRRPDKFERGARTLLERMAGGPSCLHPARPTAWGGHPHLGDFEETIAACLGRDR